MTSDELNVLKAEMLRERAKIDEQKLQVQKDRLALEKTVAKKWGAPLLGLSGVLTAAILSAALGFVTWRHQVQADDDRTAIEATKLQADTKRNTQEFMDRLSRIKADYAHLLSDHSQKLFGDATQKKIIFVISQLYPTDVVRDVLPKLSEIAGVSGSDIQSILSALSPADLTGDYVCSGKCQRFPAAAKITQTKENLTFVNEVGNVSTGIYNTAVQVTAVEWGALVGNIVRDERFKTTTINWVNGSIWTRHDR